MKKILLPLMLTLSISFLFGCGKKADESKPLSEIKAEVEKMSVADLKAMAMKYKDAIVAKKADVEKITAKLKEIPATQMLGEEAKKLQVDIDKMGKSLSALMERFQIYYEQLKAKGGDVSGLQI